VLFEGATPPTVIEEHAVKRFVDRVLGEGTCSHEVARRELQARVARSYPMAPYRGAMAEDVPDAMLWVGPRTGDRKSARLRFVVGTRSGATAPSVLTVLPLFDEPARELPVLTEHAVMRYFERVLMRPASEFPRTRGEQGALWIDLEQLVARSHAVMPYSRRPKSEVHSQWEWHGPAVGPNGEVLRLVVGRSTRPKNRDQLIVVTVLDFAPVAEGREEPSVIRETRKAA
jgi:hypothetical protein